MIAQQHFSPLAYFKRVLLPNMPQLINVTGTIFRVKEASKQFFVRFDNGARIPIECGLGIGFNPPDFFKTVEITNENAENLTVEFYVGSADVIDSRLNSRFDRDNPIVMKEAPTFITGVSATIASNSFLIIPSRSLYGQQRKQIVIYNDSDQIMEVHAVDEAASTLNAAIIGKIPINSNYTLFTSAAIGLFPNVAAPKTIRYLETVYF